MKTRQAAPKDRTGAGGMPVTGDQQNIGGMEWLHAFGDIARLSEGRIFFKRTDADLRRHLFGVLPDEGFSIFGGRVAEISRVRGSVNEQMAAVTGAQQLHATAVTFVLAVTGQDDDHVRLFWMIAHQHAAGESGKQKKSQKQDQEDRALYGPARHAARPGGRRRRGGLGLG